MKPANSVEPHGTGVRAHTACGARSRRGSPCRNLAGLKTGHAGEGRCYLHGGLTPIKHGRYSGPEHERIRDLIGKHNLDPEPLNILPELAAARGLFEDYINRYTATTDALLAWHESYEVTRVPLPEDKVMAFEAIVTEWEIALREGKTEATDRQISDIQSGRAFVNLLRGKGVASTKPRQILDITDVYRLVSEITRIAEREWKRLDANAISRQDMQRVIEQMAKGVQKHITEPGALQAIRNEWLSIAIT